MIKLELTVYELQILSNLIKKELSENIRTDTTSLTLLDDYLTKELNEVSK